MKTFGRIFILIFLAATTLASCNGFTAAPTAHPTATVSETLTPTEKVIPTETALPAITATITSLPSLTPMSLPPTPLSRPDGIVYYYFVQPTESPAPEGSVVIMPDAYILAPAPSNTPKSKDTAADLRVALETALTDLRNGWFGNNLEVTKVDFRGGRVDVALQGEYFGVGSVTLTAARMQILLTLFANPAVESATVTLNGDTIANIDISMSKDAKPADYVYTRSEIETYITEHAYVAP